MTKRWTVLLLALIVSSVGLSTPRALAATTCSGAAQARFAGYYQSSSNPLGDSVEGVVTYIVVRDGTSCSGNANRYNSVSTWAMIADRGGTKWGQVGFTHEPGYALRWFSQWYDGSSATTNYGATVTSQLGARHTFRVFYYASCNCHRSVIDSTIIGTAPFDVFATFGPQYWSPEFLSETKYAQSDIPGRASAKVSYTGLGYQDYSDATRGYPCGLTLTNQNSSRWSVNSLSCIAFDSWTG